MTISRRNVLLQGCAIGAGAIAAEIPGVVALAQGQPPQRRSLGDLQLNDPIVQAWRGGVKRLKQNPARGPISWAKFAAIHGNANAFNLCPHGNWYFLPWHRAFLLMYERTVRQLTGHNDFALPYWDWTADRQLPAALSQPKWNGQRNPLYESQRSMSPTDSLPTRSWVKVSSPRSSARRPSRLSGRAGRADRTRSTSPGLTAKAAAFPALLKQRRIITCTTSWADSWAAPNRRWIRSS